MTDITELAQSLKAAAEKAQIEEGLTWFSEEQLSHEDGIALHKADAEFIALANPANILALVEALEKAQQRNTEQDAELEREREKSRRVMSRIAVLEESHAQVIQSRDHYKRMSEEGLKQLAESRTVTVKLPEPFKLAKSSSGLTYYYADEVNEALTAQGIKWEAE